uniref:tetratricopeptide repeat protein n=1 Tax=Geitlerinema sp. PCC 9228 TaxID=111611 RepID=UPI001114E434
GEVYFWQRQWENAIACFEKVIHLHPQLASAYRGLAKTYQKRNQPQPASQAWFEALQLQPEWGTSTEHLTLGNNLLGYGDWEKAKQCYQQAIAIQPDCSQAYHNLAEIHFTQQQWQDAIDGYRREIEINPSEAAANSYWKLIQALVKTRQWEKAIDCCQQATQHFPEDGYFYQQLGWLYQQQGEWEAAIENYQQAIDCDASLIGCYIELGDILLQKQSWQEAVEIYQQALNIDSEKAILYGRLGKAFYNLQQWEAAVVNLQKAIELEPTTPWYYKNLSDVWYALQDWEQAATAYHQWEQKKKTQQQQHQSTIAIQTADDNQANLNLGRFDSNNHRCEKEIKVSEVDLASYRQHIETLIQNEQWQEAMHLCQKATELFPADAYFYQKLAWVYQQQKQWDIAIATYRQAICCDTSRIWSYIRLGELFLQLQRWQEAVTVYQEALAVNPQQPVVYNKLGIAWHRRQHWEKAIAAFQQAIELDPQKPWYYKQLGDCWYALQNWEQAAFTYQQWEQAIKRHRQQQAKKGEVEVKPIAAKKQLFRRIVYDASEKGGLCNRLRVLASCLCLGYFWQIPVYMRWLPVKTCSCSFEDIYQPICETVEADTIDKWLAEEASQTLHVPYTTASITWLYKKYLKKDVASFAYHQKYRETIRSFQLQPHLQTVVDTFIQNNWQHPIVGLHVRRTDHYKSVIISSDDRFFQTMERHLQQGIEKFFLATDNSETQTKFREKFGNRILTYSQDFNQSQLRQTTMQTAAIELHLLANTQKIIGSFDSSFSQYAADIGNIPLDLPWETASSEVS